MRRKSWLGNLLFAGIILACMPADAKAQESPQPFPGGRETPFMKLWNPFKEAGIHGYAAFDYFSSDKALTKNQHFPGLNLVLQSEPSFGDHVRLYGEARVMAQDLNHSVGPNNWDGRTQTLYQDVTLELREGYVHIYAGDLELRVGKQIVVWGRADEINPTDWLSARNLTLLFPDPFDQRIGVFGVKADYYLPRGFRLTGVWQPIPTTSTIPLPIVPGVMFRRQLPDIKIENGELGFKLDQSGGEIEWSVSYFTGFNKLPEVNLMAPVPPAMVIGLSHHRIHGAGADFVYVHRSWGFRGEGAYVHTKNPMGRRRDIQTPYAFYVLGVEKDFGDNTSLIVQYYGRRVFHRYETISGLVDDQIALYNALFTSQLDTWQNGISVRFNKKWWNNTLDLDLTYAINFERTNWLLRPKVTYDLTDEWKIMVGGEIYKGNDVSQFGFLEDNTTAFAEVRWSF